MENVIPVLFQRSTVGSITVEQSPKEFTALRTADGFELALPITVRLGMTSLQAPQPLLSDVSATLYIGTEQVGKARCDWPFFTGGMGGDSPTATGNSASLVWDDTLPALLHFEELRAANPPQLRIELRAEVCCLLSSPSGLRVRGEPQLVTGRAYVTYPTDVWARMLRELKLVDYVFVQVPLPSEPPSGWDEVWREVGRARDALEIGGDTGWTASVVAVRRALEAWQEVEPERPWPASAEERRALSKRERLECLRWSLHQAAHPAVHDGDGWSRQEANLMLVTLCGLLAARNPGPTTPR